MMQLVKSLSFDPTLGGDLSGVNQAEADKILIRLCLSLDLNLARRRGQ